MSLLVLNRRDFDRRKTPNKTDRGKNNGHR